MLNHVRKMMREDGEDATLPWIEVRRRGRLIRKDMPPKEGTSG